MRLGVDLGGTAIKAGLVDDGGRVLAVESAPTHAEGGAEAVFEALIALCRRQIALGGVTSVGIGSAGYVDIRSGVLVRAGNLPFSNFPLRARAREALALPVEIGNDANCALYGELFAGGHGGIDNLLMVTVGTGIGGGALINGAIYRGVDGRACEFGHMIVRQNGETCRCGRRGCWERYASASALGRMSEAAARARPESALARLIARQGGSAGEMAFEAARAGCPVAEAVIGEYADNLATGLNNIATVFRPERITLSGAIFAQGEYLLSRLRARIIAPERLTVSALGNAAGLIGASLLVELYAGKGPLASY